MRNLISVEAKGGMQIELMSQAARIATRDANGQGARVSYGGKVYKVSRRIDDAAGMTALILALEAAAPTP
jgi:hypothetical protein